MPDKNHLPYLLSLLDDDSAVVQEALMKEFAAFGAGLREELARIPGGVNKEQHERISELLEEHGRRTLREAWSTWLVLTDEVSKLERAYGLLSDFQAGAFRSVSLGHLLDELAAEYRREHGQPDVYRLSRFLFAEKKIRGASDEDYYDPRNSDLTYVIQEKRGIPISLASVYILTGARLGLSIEGCNYPGHFLARTEMNEKLYLVDCYNGGRFIEEGDLLDFNKDARAMANEVIHSTTDSEAIIRRVLRNLAAAYQRKPAPKNADLMNFLLEVLEKRTESAGETY